MKGKQRKLKEGKKGDRGPKRQEGGRRAAGG
jgi:hypothetical protein